MIDLDFYLEVEERKLMSSEEFLGLRAQELCAKYVVENAPESINLPSVIQKELLENLETKKAGSKDFFENAQNHILKVISDDSWRRFIESSFYEIWLKELEKDELGKVKDL